MVDRFSCFEFNYIHLQVELNFIFSYFELNWSHHFQLQIKIAVWLQTKILQILCQIKHFLKISSHTQNSP